MKFILYRVIGIFLLGIACGVSLFWWNTTRTVNPLEKSHSLVTQAQMFFESRSIRSCLRQKTDQKIIDCVNLVLRRMAEAHGARHALDVIEPISQKVPLLLQRSHELSHTIGDFAVFASYGLTPGFTHVSRDLSVKKMARALVDCDGWGSFGCYHGVIEVGLSRIAPADRAKTVRQACLYDPLITSKPFYINQCMHWFGHGMAIFTDQTLLQTLAACEGVDPNFESDPVQLCLSGVFHAAGLPGSTDVDFLGNLSRVYKKGDVYFPCQDIPDRFRGHCYSHIASRSWGLSQKEIYAACEGIPESDPVKKADYTRRCYDSQSNSTLVAAEMDPQKTVDSCRALGSLVYRSSCFAGAARYAILRDPLLNNTVPFSICAKADPDAQARCYGAIGFGIWENYYSKDILTSHCAKVPKQFQSNCMNRAYSEM